MGHIKTMLLERLPPEAHPWVETITDEEALVIKYKIGLVGGQTFVTHWRHHQDELEYWRNF